MNEERNPKLVQEHQQQQQLSSKNLKREKDETVI